jgi:hypothetical protein
MVVVIKEMIKDAQRADQKSVTSERSLHLAVNINIAAFTTNEKRPRVIKIVGRVYNLTIEPKMPFIKPKRRATQR